MNMVVLPQAVLVKRIYLFIACLMAVLVLMSNKVQAQLFDIESGNAAIEVVIPTVAPVIFTVVSPSGDDTTLALSVTTMITNGWRMFKKDRLC